MVEKQDAECVGEINQVVVILTTTKVLKTPGRGDGVKDGEFLFKSEQIENQKLSTNVYTSSRNTIVNLSIRFKIQRILKVGKVG